MKRKKILKKLNRTLKEYQPTIQTFGILIAAILFFLTLYTTILTKRSLDLAFKQQLNQELPIWDWKLVENEGVLLRPYNPDIKIEFANAYFSNTLFNNNLLHNLDQPDFELNLRSVKDDLLEKLHSAKQHIPHDNFLELRERNNIPFGLEVSYIQYGQAKKIFGIYFLQYSIIIKDGESKEVFLDGILFDKYLDENENMKNEIDKRTELINVGKIENLPQKINKIHVHK